MELPMKFALPALLLAASFATTLHAGETPTDAHAADRAQIQQLVARFKGAIIAKDGKALTGMFLPGASWLMGLDKASLARIQARKPEARQFMPEDYRKFGESISQAPKPVEETFSNVRIETDGIVGIVYFDYRFLLDGRATNHGNETWQLVHTGDGWRISAMLYSAIVDDIHP
jgi:hypothetical protein